MTDDINKLIEEATTDINIVANIVIPQMPAFGLEASSTAVQSVVDAARNLASALSAVAGERDALAKLLHSRQSHPDYEYATTDGPRKAFYNQSTPPDGDGWEVNVDCGRDGWERFDYHEEAYWRRRKAALNPEAK